MLPFLLFDEMEVEKMFAIVTDKGVVNSQEGLFSLLEKNGEDNVRLVSFLLDGVTYPLSPIGLTGLLWVFVLQALPLEERTDI